MININLLMEIKILKIINININLIIIRDKNFKQNNKQIRMNLRIIKENNKI